jgi:hypothetical protein
MASAGRRWWGGAGPGETSQEKAAAATDGVWPGETSQEKAAAVQRRMASGQEGRARDGVWPGGTSQEKAEGLDESGAG